MFERQSKYIYKNFEYINQTSCENICKVPIIFLNDNLTKLCSRFGNILVENFLLLLEKKEYCENISDKIYSLSIVMKLFT